MTAGAVVVIAACCWAGPVLLGWWSARGYRPFLRQHCSCRAGAAVAAAGSVSIILRHYNKKRCGAGMKSSTGNPGGDHAE